MPDLPHDFADERLLERALTHASADGPDNERLEFLGDAVLDLVAAEELFRRRPHADEGELTTAKASLVSRATLAGAARRMELARAATLGLGLHGAQRAGELSHAVLANLYEAVLGAIYLDAGLDAARAFVLETLAEELAHLAEHGAPKSPKQALQEHAQRDGGAPPVYHLTETRGEAHDRAFRVEAEVAGRRFPGAWGRTRREAEAWAAQEALDALDALDAEG